MSKKKAQKPRRETFAHKAEQTVWELVKRTKHEVVIRSPFTGESRRPKPMTFARDYEAMELKAGRV
ncbi:hypothetical protein PBI_DEWDROP_108 [Microbacterium phage Dewdrop]|nr:hypothetical protein PBI_LEAF_108 [Microbacterium phage Leaf]QGZ17476.1 hypothetical protein PBI_DEWDROP_108 [Microbacterium phage Dewdrop]